FYFGINGIVTFKNSKLRDVLPAIGAERILLETDAPYLAPVPYRGKRNETAYVVETARMIADALSLDLEEIADMTTGNAKKLFTRME
ncbi:MAG: TatD family hydrolase, partial [Duncaniella sp.]|nr:TatD family hydrolase [Duncaniella sp.]